MTLEHFLGFAASLFRLGIIWYVVWTVIAILAILLFWLVIGPRQDREFERKSAERRAEIERRWRGW